MCPEESFGFYTEQYENIFALILWLQKSSVSKFACVPTFQNNYLVLFLTYLSKRLRYFSVSDGRVNFVILMTPLL